MCLCRGRCRQSRPAAVLVKTSQGSALRPLAWRALERRSELSRQLSKSRLGLRSHSLFLSWTPGVRSPASDRMSHGVTSEVNLTLESGRHGGCLILERTARHTVTSLQADFERKCFQLQVDTSAAANTFTLTRSIRLRLSRFSSKCQGTAS